MPDSETLKLLMGPAGALVVLGVLSWKLWSRTEKLQDELIAMVKDSIRADVDLANKLLDLARLIRERVT